MSRWRRRLDRWGLAYLALAGAVGAYALGFVLNGRRSNDVYLHAAVIRRLADDPWSPENPLVGGDTPDPGFTPYALVLGLISRWSGLDPFVLIDIAGLALVVGFLVLWPRAVAVLTGERRAAALALLLVLVAWGIRTPWRWSGHLHLNALGFMIGYPAMMAWCALLGAVVVAGRGPATAGTWRALVVLLALIALVHPLTLLGAVPLVAGVVLREGGRRAVVPLAAAGAVAVAFALAWPWFSLLEVARSGDYDGVHRLLYTDLTGRAVLAVPGLVALAWLTVRRPRTWLPLALTASVAVAAVLFGGWTERWTLGRALPFAVFAGSLALGALLTERLASAGRRRGWIGTALPVVVLVGLGTVSVLPGVAAAVPSALLPASLADDERLTSEMDAFAGFEDELGPGAVVAALDLTARKGVIASGAATVYPGFASPFLDDIERRAADASNALYGTPDDRAEVIERRGITHVVVPTGAGPGWLDGPVASSGRYDLHRVRPL